VAHAYNPSYSEGRDQEDWGSKPTQANSSRGPILKKPFTKRAGGVTQGVGPKLKPQYLQKKKKSADGMAQVVECLPSKCEALSSNSSIKKKTKTL
jgi:hypothetical protein